MGLRSALNIGKNAIIAQQRALQTVGNNIANANTEGYSRQRVSFAPIGSSREGSYFQGLGVGINGVQRIYDRAIEIRLLEAGTELGSLQQQRVAYSRLETSFNALSDRSLGERMGAFFNAANELSQSPQNIATRRVFIEMAQSLAENFNSISSSLQNMRGLTDGEVQSTVGEINRLTTEIAKLNDAIVKAEVGGTIQGEANDLRDAREQSLRELSELIDIKVIEQNNSSVDVVTSGAFLVKGRTDYNLTMDTAVDRNVRISEISFEDGTQAFNPQGGALGGLLESRDQIFSGFMQELDTMARAVITEVNAIHTAGRPLTPIRKITSNAFSVPHALGNAPLAVNGTISQTAAAGGYLVDKSLVGYPASIPGGSGDFFIGAKVLITSGEREGESAIIQGYDPGSGRIGFEPPLPSIAKTDTFQITSSQFPVSHGSFDLVVYNAANGISNTFNIEIDADGLPTPPATDDTTLPELVQDINDQLIAQYGANPPVSARITQDFRLEIVSNSNDVDFRFENDTSGFLTANGMNTFFEGYNAGTMNVQQRLLDAPEKLAISTDNNPGNNDLALALAALQGKRILSDGNATFDEYYQGVIGAMAVQGAEAIELSDNQAIIKSAIEGERQAISGVNLDEEAVALMVHQRAFQAAARFLSIVDELMTTLIQTL
ncbi:MAG: flagellar hook-associated protein FlgK [Planctomycetes bacterium]|nr:flagellar hook-associated protein FlgK [Planctomycetota bacterium]